MEEHTTQEKTSKPAKETKTVKTTADHGCAPTFKGTDHTREYVPLLVIGENIEPQNLGTKESYAFVSELVKRYLN